VIIANPIYDVTFKRLLENDRAAKFLIGTIMGCEVLSLERTAQEYAEIAKDGPVVSLFRMDFAATIVTKEEGEKRVIIEMQKAKVLDDVFRFRRYLGKEYADSKLPIIAIYILGFPLSVDSPAFGNVPKYRDLQTGEEIRVRDLFVNGLSHSAYFIQTTRIKPGLNTKLDRLLSIFEQAHFIGDGTTMKDYLFDVDDPDVKGLVNILEHVAADPERRKELEKEQYYQVAMEDAFWKQNMEMAKYKREIEEAIQEKDEALQEIEVAKRETEAAKRETEEADRKAEEFKQETEAAKQETEAANRREEELKLKFALKLKKDGTPPAEIAELTGLSAGEIEKL
jgi:flagellar biosynthesis GTPase FlhF